MDLLDLPAHQIEILAAIESARVSGITIGVLPVEIARVTGASTIVTYTSVIALQILGYVTRSEKHSDIWGRWVLTGPARKMLHQAIIESWEMKEAV